MFDPRSRNYILGPDGQPVREPDLLRWARWFGRANRTVARDTLPDGVEVSTVFLGIDHNWSGEGPPILWETMVFGGRFDQQSWRYASRAAALAHHRALVEKLRGAAIAETRVN